MPRVSTKIQLQNNLHRFFLASIVEEDLDDALIYQLMSEALKQQRHLVTNRLVVSKFN
jgi:hypothetical protein